MKVRYSTKHTFFPLLTKMMEMIRKLLIIALPMLLLSSCLADKSSPKVVVLKNPATLDFQNCEVQDWGSKEAYAANKKCVEQWQQQGYVIWGSQ